MEHAAALVATYPCTFAGWFHQDDTMAGDAELLSVEIRET